MLLELDGNYSQFFFFLKVSFQKRSTLSVVQNIFVICLLKRFTNFILKLCMCLSVRHALVRWGASYCSGQKNSEATSIRKYSTEQDNLRFCVCVRACVCVWCVSFFSPFWKRSVCMHPCSLLVIFWICFSQVVDVAKAIVNAIKDPDAKGKTYALAG